MIDTIYQEPIELFRNKSLDYTEIRRVNPRPPIYKKIDVVASQSDMEAIGACPHTARKLKYSTVWARIFTINREKYATVDGVTLFPGMFRVRR